MDDHARQYLQAGLCVLPARRAEKRPATDAWKRYRKRLPTEAELSAWLANGPEALCIVCGRVSGHAEMIDFDAGGELFDAWATRIPAELLSRLVIERTQRDGRHVFYRCQTSVCGNMKLAQHQRDGKIVTLIETRGEGGLFLCAPTPGYALLQGDLCNPPVLTEAERDVLLRRAWELNEYVPPVVDCPTHVPPVGQRVPLSAGPCASGPDDGDRPGDDFNKRGDVRTVLRQHGWTLAKAGENEYWRRPDKTSGWSATLKDGVFYVFSANAAPFEPNRGYAPFAVYTMLEHGGDWAQAASSLRLSGYGGDSPAETAHGVDISGIIGQNPSRAADDAAIPPAAPENPDPGPMPEDLLEVPGFIRQVMDYTLATAPYPQPVLAFAAALTLQSFLAGRKVRDAADNRTSLYVLALANSGAGKDHPRKVNQRICIEAGLQDSLGDSFASGEGIEDRMFLTPSLLFQTDEIDGLMNAINQASDARHESIMNALLKFYTSSNAVYPMRVKAGKTAPGVIDQPSLCMLGTAVPKYYYEALSVRMLNNGFFARLLILEAGRRGRGQTPISRPVPTGIVDTARWWAQFRPGTGNLENWHPVPALVEATPAAEAAMEECRTFADDRYAEAEDKDDPAAMAIWARAYEKTRKLALNFAVSENHRSPRIDEPAVRWAWRFVDHQTRRMLFMAGQHVAEGEFDARCKRMIEVLTSWRQRRGQAWMPHWELSRRLKWSDKDIEEVRNALRGQRRLEFEIGSTPDGGRIGQRYRLSV